MEVKVIILFWLSLMLLGCNQVSKRTDDSYLVATGSTMGTYYRIVWEGQNLPVVQIKVDSLLNQINQEVSTYEEGSFITRVNNFKANREITNAPSHFTRNLERAQLWYKKSSGYMDVSIGPLVNYWGFGQVKRPVTKVDSTKIDSIKTFVGLDKWNVSTDLLSIEKINQSQQLDFSALAKGYAVDEIGKLLNSLGSQNYLVDIGGEGMTRGLNPKGVKWAIGISAPSPDARLSDYKVLVYLKDKALATSGNYRNFYEVDGRKYGHTIDPHSGYPYHDELLSVTIVADKCIDADAIATACMAMGYTKASTFISGLTNVSACFLIGIEDGSIKTKFENGFVQYITGR